MLVLSRRPQQTIIVGEGPDRVTITVAGIDGNQVNIGIDAPREVPVHRGEVYQRIQEKMQTEAHSAGE